MINHINYCINFNIEEVKDYIEAYLYDNNESTYERYVVVDYVLKFVDIEIIINKILSKVDFETSIIIINKIFEKNREIILPYIEHKCKYAKKLDKQKIYVNYLIQANSEFGIKKLYTILRKNMCYTNKYYYTNTYLANNLENYNNLNCINYLEKILLLSYDPNFKDVEFHSIKNGCCKAFISIALSDINNGTHIIVIERLKNIIKTNTNIEDIGFLNYTIEEIEDKINQLNKPKMNISKVIQIIDELLYETKNIWS